MSPEETPRKDDDDPRRKGRPRGEGRGDRRDDHRGPRREGGRDDRRGPRREGGRDGAPRREWKPREGGPRREGGRDDRRGPRREGGRDDRRNDRRDDVPQNEAQRRRSEVFARKGPRKYGKDKPFGPRPDREERVVDEGSIRPRRFDSEKRPRRDAPRGKSREGARQDGPLFPTPPALQEPLASEVRRAVGERRYEFVSRAVSRALVAYDAERYREALATLSQVLEDLWLIADIRVLAGRLEYRAQHWKAAAEHLEFARASDRTDMTNMPVLIDCYRALKRYEIVDELWSELKEASPHPMIMAEGRVSAAMSYADRGDLNSAIRIMTHGTEPRQVQPHHLLEWYVLGDLHDRAGDPVTAKRLFVKVAHSDAKFYDVAARLAALGE